MVDPVGSLSSKRVFSRDGNNTRVPSFENGYESVPGSFPFCDSIVCIENWILEKLFCHVAMFIYLLLGNFECQLSLQSGFLSQVI